MSIIDVSVTQTLYLTQEDSVDNFKTTPIYGSLEDADNFFAQRLDGQRWAYKSPDKRVKALIMATRRIEALNFVGSKAVVEQPLQFPRGTDTKVPVVIEQASYLVALALLKGIDSDTEADNLSLTVHAFSGLRSEYDRSFASPYVRAGIPSQEAWNLLTPWLDPVLGIKLVRDS